MVYLAEVDHLYLLVQPVCALIDEVGAVQGDAVREPDLIAAGRDFKRQVVA